LIHFTSPELPAPVALRLVCKGTPSSLKRPFGLSAWAEGDGVDALVLLDPVSTAETGDLTPGEVLQQIPLAESLPSGQLVLVLGELRASGAIFTRLLGSRRKVGRASRAAALLAAGYVQLGAGVDPKSGHDLVWGYAPQR
jgi:hypothetical protein